MHIPVDTERLNTIVVRTSRISHLFQFTIRFALTSADTHYDCCTTTVSDTFWCARVVSRVERPPARAENRHPTQVLPVGKVCSIADAARERYFEFECLPSVETTVIWDRVHIIQVIFKSSWKNRVRSALPSVVREVNCAVPQQHSSSSSISTSSSSTSSSRSIWCDEWPKHPQPP